jgi:hypothetical protein
LTIKLIRYIFTSVVKLARVYMAKELVKVRLEISPLVPEKGSAKKIVDELVDLMGRTGKSVQVMMTADCAALNADEMQYFGAEYFGKVPSYARFMSALHNADAGLAMELKEIEAQVLGGYYEGKMRDILETPTIEFDGYEGRRFNWAEKLAKMQERKLDRIDRRRNNDGMEKGVDLTLKIIEALSNTQLEKVKKVMDAEWSMVDSEGDNNDGK